MKEKSNLNGKKILLISARYFDYEKAIVKRLEEMGAEVDFYDERPSNSILSKGIIRVSPWLLQLKIQKYYRKISKQIVDKKYDYFLLIKGESIPFDFLEDFKSNQPQAETIFYMYDSVYEYPRFCKLSLFFNKNFTAEAADSKRYGFSLRPPFFIDEYKNHNAEKKYDLSFVGSAHTDRYNVAKKIQQQVESIGLNTYFYFFAPSKIAFTLKRIFDPHFKKFNIKKVNFKSLIHSEISEIYNKSKAVLDINKPFQLGVSMRTCEILGAEKKLITTNPEIRNYPFYNENNILIIDREEPKIPSRFFETEFQKLNPKDVYMLSLDSWIECLFLNSQDDYWNIKKKTTQNN